MGDNLAENLQVAIIAPSENTDVTLGMVVQAINELKGQNADEHKKIFARLDEGDQYLAVFKLSRCGFSWLNRNGVLKYSLAAAGFLILDWASRYFYWDIFPKP